MTFSGLLLGQAQQLPGISAGCLATGPVLCNGPKVGPWCSWSLEDVIHMNVCSEVGKRPDRYRPLNIC